MCKIIAPLATKSMDGCLKLLTLDQLSTSFTSAGAAALPVVVVVLSLLGHHMDEVHIHSTGIYP